MRYTDADVQVSMFVTDDGGALTNADTVPTLTIYGPSGSSSPILANPSTGEYTATFTPAVAGMWVGCFAATVDGVDQVQYARWLIHDGRAEADRSSLPAGVQSWSSAV